MRRDATLPEAHAPGLLRDRCTSCKGDSLLRIRSQTEHEIRAECTWCGAMQRRTAKPSQSWQQNFAPKVTNQERAELAMKAWNLRLEGMRGSQVAAALGIKVSSVHHLYTLARRQLGIGHRSRRALLEGRADMRVLYVVQVRGGGMTESAFARYANATRQTVAAVRVALYPETHVTQKQRAWQRAVEMTRVMDMLERNPNIRSPEIAAALGMRPSTATRRLHDARVLAERKLDCAVAA